MIDGLDVDRGLSLLAKAGATAVEPAFIEGYMPFDEATFTEAAGARLGMQLRKAGLGIHALSAHTDLGRPDGADRLHRRLDFAAAAGARVLVTNAATVDRAEACRKAIATVSPELCRRDIILKLENPGHGTGAMLPDGAGGARLIADIGDPRIRLNYDVGNAFSHGACEGLAADDLQAALPFSAQLHLKDLRAIGADWEFCPIGEGLVG